MTKKQDIIQEYKKKDGSKAFGFQVYLGTDPMTGKQKRTRRRGFSSRREALLARSRLMIEIEENGFKKQNKATFKEVYELWYESAYKNTVKESTRAKAVELFDNHILPAFGSYRMDKITIKYCQTVVNGWCSKLKNFRSVKGHASRVFDYAVTLEMIRSNNMKKIIMPKRKEEVDDEKENNFFSKEELKQFMDASKATLSPMWFTFFRVLAFSGFRKSEALALTWHDVDFKESTISITKAVARGDKGRILIQTPKNKSSVRTISMDAVTMNILKDWRKEQAVTMLKYGHNTINKKQLVFSTFKNTLIDPNATVRHIDKVITEHNFNRITTHGLRHTHCSLLFESGAPIEVVKERLGHSDIATTMNIYTHVTKASVEKTADQFAAYVNF